MPPPHTSTRLHKIELVLGCDAEQRYHSGTDAGNMAFPPHIIFFLVVKVYRIKEFSHIKTLNAHFSKFIVQG